MRYLAKVSVRWAVVAAACAAFAICAPLFVSPARLPARVRFEDGVPAAPAPLKSASADEQAAVPSPSRVEEQTFFTRALGRWMPYSIYLPPGYESDSLQRYPTLYLLHGIGGNYVIEWRKYGAFEAADALIQSGTIPRMIVVIPEGEQSYWVDHADGGPAWGTYVARDLVANIDGQYRTRALPESRAVGGNSMGAHGALQLAMNWPVVFGVVGMHSPTLRSREELPAYFGDEVWFEAHDPLTLVERNPGLARTLRLWVDAGTDDGSLPAVAAFHQRLNELGIPHEFHVFGGPHDGPYWTANMATYLGFYGGALAHKP